jgi:hypothetical protein
VLEGEKRMSNRKFNFLVLLCAILWLGMTFAAIPFSEELMAMPSLGRLLVSFGVSAPVVATLSLLTQRLAALKHDEYQQQLLRGQVLWASIMAIMMTATTGFAMAYAPDANGMIYTITVTTWYAGFLLRGLTNATVL